MGLRKDLFFGMRVIFNWCVGVPVRPEKANQISLSGYPKSNIERSQNPDMLNVSELPDNFSAYFQIETN